jgi:hypothetical protein
VWERYGLRELVQRVFKDEILVTDDGAITDTRNYGTYSKAFIETAQRKWVEVKDWVKPGRILDIGCASGQILLEAGKEERLQSSDLIGVEADRWLHAEAVHRKNQGHFKNPSTFFYKGNILENHLFTPRSINTTLTLALTHEIYSYGDKEEDLQKLSDAILLHTRPDGVWINSDTAGPQQPGREVDLWLSLTDKEPGKNQEQVNQAAGMSTSHKFWEYCKDLQELTGRKIPVTIVECKVEHQGTPMEVVRVNLKEAMEYLLHKDYTDNWVSELHETYTYRNWEDWKKHLTQSGWEILPGSGGYTNQWIVENRLEGHARITDPGTGTRIPWPDTHMRFAVKPA